MQQIFPSSFTLASKCKRRRELQKVGILGSDQVAAGREDRLGSNKLDRLPLRSRGLLSSLLVLVLVLAAFTPYLGTSLDIRLEHILIYVGLGCLILFMLGGRRLQPTKQVQVVTLCWCALGCLSTINTLGYSISFPGSNDPLAVLDSFTLPISVFLLAFAIGRFTCKPDDRLLRLACWTAVVALSLNSILILAFEPSEILEFLRRFWSNPASQGLSVAEMNYASGRYGGIFNQPFNGGVAYSLGIAAWVYVIDESKQQRRVSWILGLVTMALLMVGGVSTDSKVFVYGALVVLLVTFFAGSARSFSRFLRLGSKALIAIAGISIAALLGLVSSYDRTLNLLTIFWADDRNPYAGLRGATGGRATSIGDYIDQFVKNFTLAGVNFGGTDNAYVAYLQGGGIIGLLLAVTVLLALFSIARRRPKGSAERVLGLSLVAVGTLAGFGSVALQTDRSSTLLWIFMGLLAVPNSAQEESVVRTPRKSVVGDRGYREAPVVWSRWVRPVESDRLRKHRGAQLGVYRFATPISAGDPSACGSHGRGGIA